MPHSQLLDELWEEPDSMEKVIASGHADGKFSVHI
jgi:hypothetical protein